MKPEIKEKWVTALESGKYKQGRGCLKSESGVDTKYCCLGVLAELAVKEGVIPDPVRGVSSVDGVKLPYFAYGDEKESDYLPEEVMTWAGITYSNGNFYIKKLGVWDDFGGYESLVDLNDANWDFKAIAEVIRKLF